MRTHLEAQMAFLNDMSKSIFRSYQKLCDLNIQLTQTLLEETALASHQMLTADRQTDVIGAVATRAQPATDKLRAYQQHISKVAADAQVELARVTEEHVQETTRTARALADEVQRVATEETERNMRTQQDTLRKFSDPFQNDGSNYMRGNGNAGGRAGASMQSGSQSGSAQGSSAGQGEPQQPASGGKAGSGARKETGGS
ncbi:MAG: phasin family protein [Pseudomonadota bacterium]